MDSTKDLENPRVIKIDENSVSPKNPSKKSYDFDEVAVGKPVSELEHLSKVEEEDALLNKVIE